LPFWLGILLPPPCALGFRPGTRDLTAARPIPRYTRAGAQLASLSPRALRVAEAELAPQREALAQEAAAIKAVLERNQAENDEALHMLEIEIDGLRAQLSDASNREEKTLARLEETSQALGYAKAKLDATEQEHRNKISEMETKIIHLEDQLKSKYTTHN